MLLSGDRTLSIGRILIIEQFDDGGGVRWTGRVDK
jgi:hypothetical protein